MTILENKDAFVEMSSQAKIGQINLQTDRLSALTGSPKRETGSGHALRVCTGSRALATAVHKARDGMYADIAFTNDQLGEMEIAALLHDFGQRRVRRTRSPGLTDDALTLEELEEARSHMERTVCYLSRIPWRRSLINTAWHAEAHRKILYIAGFPHVCIPLEAKIIAVVDFFDILTRCDSPSKKTVSVSQALRILAAEASSNRIDPDLFDLFCRAKIYDSLDCQAVGRRPKQAAMTRLKRPYQTL